MVEDRDRSLWVLEGIAPHACEHKQEISRTLASLHAKGLRCIHPYLRTRGDEWLSRYGNRGWQMRPYIDGMVLPRPAYALDRWRGRACAGFLADLRDKAGDIPFLPNGGPFSVTRFIREVSHTLATHDPRLVERLARAFDFIEQEFAGVEKEVPTVFCHGDFHPLNLIWSEGGIRSVIDWEFLGNKPEAYDPANLIGCVGFEDPAGLARGFVTGLIAEMEKGDVLSPACRRHLPEWVAALRFAWLSDWLRRGDAEMVDLEIAYIDLLIDNRRVLRDIWKQAS